MILLIGNNRDDLLYFDTVINNRKEEVVLDKYPVTVGTIANQAVILLNNVYTNVLASLIVGHIIEKYYVLFVIKIGRSTTLSKSFKNGDIAISKRVKSIDVDVTDLQGTKLGQIPGLEDAYDTKNEIYISILNAFAKRTNVLVKEATVLSSSVHYIAKNQVADFISDDYIFGEPINNVIFDSEAFGIATACALYQIPFVDLTVVLNHIGEEFDTDDYIKVLKQYSNIGKVIVNTIGDIGSNEVLRG